MNDLELADRVGARLHPTRTCQIFTYKVDNSGEYLKFSENRYHPTVILTREEIRRMAILSRKGEIKDYRDNAYEILASILNKPVERWIRDGQDCQLYPTKEIYNPQ